MRRGRRGGEEGNASARASLLRKDSRVPSKEPRILKSHFSHAAAAAPPSLTTNSTTRQRITRLAEIKRELPLINLAARHYRAILIRGGLNKFVKREIPTSSPKIDRAYARRVVFSGWHGDDFAILFRRSPDLPLP